MIFNYKRGQLTIFVIIAIIIVAGIIVYFLFGGKLRAGEIPSELEPVFNFYNGCIEQEARTAIELAGSQGGYIKVPDYLPGSEYAPFSSQLNFLGFPVPYWYYVSGNGLIKEQVPSKRDIEESIAEYVRKRVNECNFDSFYLQGFSIELGEADAKVSIEDEKVDVDVISDLVVSKGGTGARSKEHNIRVNSKLGKFYNLAREIFKKQKDDAVFDTYGADVLRLYAPVDGVEISCSGKIWKTNDVINDLKLGLEANIAAIKFKGSYYDLNNKKDEYYVVDIGDNVDENVNLIYLKTMPTKVEIVGEEADNSFMIASPVGIQEGLGILGFCYSPYHFVYDVSFPVLIQIYNNDEIFQFPIVAIIDNNVVRKAIFSELEEETKFDLCEFKTQDIEVNLYDANLNRVDANVSYQCFDQRCDLGQSIGGKLTAKAQGCLNGYLLVRGGGFTEKRELFSSNNEKIADVILDKEYNVKLDLRVDGKSLDGTAIVSFVGKNNGRSISTVLPDASEIKLSEGNYDLNIYVYGNSSIVIPAGSKTECQEIPRSGLLGFFGVTKEQCFNIDIPETKIEYALRGGGKGEVYLLESQLESGKLVVDVGELPVPKSLEELQYNYASFESMKVEVLWK